MAAVFTVTRDPRRSPNTGKTFERISIAWTSHTDGAGTVAIPNLYGWLVRVVTNPGATAPTDDYDITLIDEDGLDSAQSLLLNRDTANTEAVNTFATGAPTPILLCGTYTFTLANAGSQKEGVCVLYLVESL